MLASASTDAKILEILVYWRSGGLQRRCERGRAGFDNARIGLVTAYDLTPLAGERGQMRIVEASEAASAFPSLLEEVERGETLVIAREGRAVARIVAETVRNQAEIQRAVEEIKKPRKVAGKVSIAELLEWRHEGHRY